MRLVGLATSTCALVLLPAALVFGQAPPSTGRDTVHADTVHADTVHKLYYRVLVATKNPTLLKSLDSSGRGFYNFGLDSAVNCFRLYKYGLGHQQLEQVDPRDELLIVVARSLGAVPSDTDCKLVGLRAAGITSANDIGLFLLGYSTEEQNPVSLTNNLIQKDITDAITSDYREIRLPMAQIVRYHDETGASRRVQHGQVIRLQVARRWQKGEQANPQDSIFHLHWDFQMRARTVWAGLTFPSLFSFSMAKEHTWRTLPVATATGMRIGTDWEFPRYFQLQLFFAPAFRIGGDSSATTTGAFGLDLDLGGYVGLGGGLNVRSSDKAQWFLSLEIGENLRRAIASKR